MRPKTDFPWLTEGATPQLADLGARIAACIRKHGYDERSWLMASLKRQIADIGVGKLTLSLSCDANGKWSAGEWRPA